MKRMISAIVAFFLSACAFAHVKTALGTDLIPLLERGCIRFHVGHGFMDRWSAAFSGEMNVRLSYRVADKEYESHIAEFQDIKEEITDRAGYFRMSVYYWPKATYEGLFLGVGCRYSKSRSPDCSLDIGYAIHIWKGLTMMFSYGTDLISTSRSGRHIGQGAGIGLCWTIRQSK